MCGSPPDAIAGPPQSSLNKAPAYCMVQATALAHCGQVPTLVLLPHKTCEAYDFPLGVVIWKQYRRSSQSTAITEQLSRSWIRPPATAPRGWHMRFPPCVKKYSLSQVVVTSPVLLYGLCRKSPLVLGSWGQLRNHFSRYYNKMAWQADQWREQQRTDSVGMIPETRGSAHTAPNPGYTDPTVATPTASSLVCKCSESSATAWMDGSCRTSQSETASDPEPVCP